MAIDKSVDSTLLDAAMSYEAGKIRTKLGSSAQINYDLANGKGFGDAIDAIPTGGGGGGGLKLLASGTFVKATGNLNWINIPVSYTGTPLVAFIGIDEILPDVSQLGALALFTADFASALGDDGNAEWTAYFPKPVLVAGVNTSGAWVYNFYHQTPQNVSLSATTLAGYKANNTYVLKDNTYKWFIYGLEEAST